MNEVVKGDMEIVKEIQMMKKEKGEGEKIVAWFEKFVRNFKVEGEERIKLISPLIKFIFKKKSD